MGNEFLEMHPVHVVVAKNINDAASKMLEFINQQLILYVL